MLGVEVLYSSLHSLGEKSSRRIVYVLRRWKSVSRVLPEMRSVTVALSTTWLSSSRLASLHYMRCDASGMPSSTGRRMMGVLIFCEAVMTISRRRGIPSVTLAAPWPAKWKVLSVI